MFLFRKDGKRQTVSIRTREGGGPSYFAFLQTVSNASEHVPEEESFGVRG